MGKTKIENVVSANISVSSFQNKIEPVVRNRKRHKEQSQGM